MDGAPKQRRQMSAATRKRIAASPKKQGLSATFNDTACVIHSMRVVKKGLIALAHEHNVPFSIPSEYQNWQNIIESIEKAIRDFGQSRGKSPLKVEKLKEYSAAVSQLFFVKAVGEIT